MKKISSTLIIMLFVFFARGQSVQQVGQNISYYLNQIAKWSSYTHTPYEKGDEDTLDLYNVSLMNYLKKALVKQPQILTAQLDLPERAMDIASSEDGKFRIYSWDCECGGTMHSFNSIIQYKTAKGTAVKVIYPLDSAFTDGEWNGPGFFYRRIYSITSKAGKTYYLAIRVGMYSSALYSIGVQCFTIENDSVNNSFKIFKTKKEYLNNIDISVDYTVLKSMQKEPEIRFSNNNSKMCVSLVTDDKATNKFLVYVFDGKNYVFDKNAK